MTAVDISFRSDFTVDIVESAGNDDAVLRAMLISTLKDKLDMTPEARRGRINFLMKNRHGTPFEHNLMIFRVEAPIVVYREWHRHRIGISINEQSGRYSEMPPTFYIPPPSRPLVQIGKPGAYQYVAGNPEDYSWLVCDMQDQAERQYNSYQERLRRGIAKEVARMSLGGNIFSSMYWSCNARSLMAFLSLRTQEEPFWQEWNAPDEFRSDRRTMDCEHVYTKNLGGAMFPSKPMWEIDACARLLEQIFATLFPLTHEAFNNFGRVSP